MNCRITKISIALRTGIIFILLFTVSCNKSVPSDRLPGNLPDESPESVAAKFVVYHNFRNREMVHKLCSQRFINKELETDHGYESLTADQAVSKDDAPMTDELIQRFIDRQLGQLVSDIRGSMATVKYSMGGTELDAFKMILQNGEWKVHQSREWRPRQIGQYGGRSIFEDY